MTYAKGGYYKVKNPEVDKGNDWVAERLAKPEAK